ncbi:hypothetical protein Plhal703r1_c05g0030581 [Plasmopara halstedii]
MTGSRSKKVFISLYCTPSMQAFVRPSVKWRYFKVILSRYFPLSIDRSGGSNV